MLRKLSLIALLGTMILAACSPTGDTQDDPEAVQNFFPTFENYQIEESTDFQNTVTGALTAAGIASGNVFASGMILKVDDFIDCYRDVGAFDARIFIENPSSELIQDGIRAPMAGVLAIINQDRALENLGPCLTRSPLGGAEAQSNTPEPCIGSGEFEFSGDTISYIYAATDRGLCGMFDQHFAQYQTSGG
jgi:hypothetical protein